MANALALFQDDIAADFFFTNRAGDLDTLRQQFTKTKNKVPINMFHLARDIVRHEYNYVVKYAKYQDLMVLAEEHENDVLYVQIHAVMSAFQHCVCIRNKIIYDGSIGKKIKCSEEAIQWLIKDEHYNFVAYIIEVTKKVQSRIDYNMKQKS